jgi:hypothetical protein
MKKKRPRISHFHAPTPIAGVLQVMQKFTDYFSTVGSVPWQADSVSRGKY